MERRNRVEALSVEIWVPPAADDKYGILWLRGGRVAPCALGRRFQHGRSRNRVDTKSARAGAAG
jgi:hypothetical protein